MAERTRASIWVVLLQCVVLPSLVAGQQGLRPPKVTAVVPSPPMAFRATGGTHFVYELRITNLGGQDISLTEIAVLSQHGEVLHTLVDQQLRSNLGTPGAEERAGAFEYPRWVEWQSGYDPTHIEPGMFAVAWIEVVVALEEPMPRILRHKVSVEAEAEAGEVAQAVFEAAPTRVRVSQLVLESPVRDGNWLVFGRSNAAGHRRALDGFGAISQRFAIDYSKVDDFGHRSAGDPYVIESYYGFGAEVLAIADGVVIAADDGMEDSPVGRQPSRTAPMTYGNYVDLAIADGVYALYMHLRSGSLLVQQGDTVRAGEVIAQLGSSGASASPHLHLQVSESPWGEGRSTVNALGEGIPYSHRTFDIVGAAGSPYCACDGPECRPSKPESRAGEMPIGDVIVRFGEGDGLEQNPARHAAVCAFQSAVRLGEQYRIQDALRALEAGWAQDPSLEVPSGDLRSICWNGSIAGVADLVLHVCERAVAQDPDNRNHLTARALAVALGGDLQRAASDLETFLEWERDHERSSLSQALNDGLATRSNEELRAMVGEWIAELRAGDNPFTQELLGGLRNRN